MLRETCQQVTLLLRCCFLASFTLFGYFINKDGFYSSADVPDILFSSARWLAAATQTQKLAEEAFHYWLAFACSALDDVISNGILRLPASVFTSGRGLSIQFGFGPLPAPLDIRGGGREFALRQWLLLQPLTPIQQPESSTLWSCTWQNGLLCYTCADIAFEQRSRPKNNRIGLKNGICLLRKFWPYCNWVDSWAREMWHI